MEGWIRKEIYALIINEIVDGVENYSLGMEIISNVMDMVQGEQSVVMAEEVIAYWQILTEKQ